MKIQKKTHRNIKEKLFSTSTYQLPKEEVLQATGKLRSSKARGLGMKQAELLKVHKEEGIKTLHNIINAVWETEKLPEARKTTVIHAIHTK